jgi:hypothetical protein
MGSAKKDGATPLPRKKKDVADLAKDIKILNGLRGVQRIFLPRNEEVAFTARAKSSTGSGDYLVKLKFINVRGEVSDTKKPKLLRVKTVSGRELYIEKPNVNNNPVMCSCTCDDFRFVWEFPMFRNRHMLHKDPMKNNRSQVRQATDFEDYTRITPPTVRPTFANNPNPEGRDFKNPRNVLGMCKHLFQFARFLTARDLVAGKFG